jgi:long-chain acyl-CoA synthetase
MTTLPQGRSTQLDAKQTYLAKPWLKHYPENVAAEMDIPVKSIPHMFGEIAEKYGKKTALIFYGKKISYKELGDLANRFATALSGLGVKKGDRVALLLLNSPQYIIAYLGVLTLGAVVTPVSPVYTSQEVRHQLSDSGAKTVICQDILYDNVSKTGLNWTT